MRSNIVQVVENVHIQANLYKLVLPFPHTARSGQFVMVQKEGSRFLLARPISICDVVNDELILIYQTVGRGTEELSKLKKGDDVVLTGPVGHGFPVDEIKKGQKVALVGGGVGVAPLVMTAKILKEKAIYCDAHIAFRDQSMLKTELEQHCNNVYIATETGNEGAKGFVTETLDVADYDIVYCCGPTPMMECVVKLCENTDTAVFVSLETHMGCGVGACLVCTCTDKEGNNKRTCLDGPVFNGLEVDFHA